MTTSRVRAEAAVEPRHGALREAIMCPIALAGARACDASGICVAVLQPLCLSLNIV